MSHVTVLLEEAVDALNLTPASVVVDATLGHCGHARRILDTLDTGGHLIGIDADQVAITAATDLLVSAGATVTLRRSNFADISAVLHDLGIGQVDAILADLGWRMDQFLESGKGFSFAQDEPLIMTYGDPSEYPFVASDVLNTWREDQIATILYGYGEEHYSRRIAHAILDERQIAPITTTKQLVEIISKAVPGQYRNGRINPATKTFQALRMVVNDELSVLERFLTDAVTQLAPGGRLAVITFHSIEDRVVKHFFREMQTAEVVTLVNKKPITSTRSEILQNPRARSAKLRIITKS